jgi:hypothetical protein
MKLQYYIVTLLLVLLSVPSLAQDDYDKQTSTFETKDPHIFENQTIWGAGIQASLLSGMGIGARYHPPGRFGFQVIGGGFSLEHSTPYSFGAEAQFDFDARGISRFYGFLGLGYYSLGKDDDPDTEEDESEDKLEGPFRIGMGGAYEWSISSKMVFNVGIALVYHTNGAYFPLPQASVFYYFN